MSSNKIGALSETARSWFSSISVIFIVVINSRYVSFRLLSLLHHSWASEGSSLVDHIYVDIKAQWKTFLLQLISGKHFVCNQLLCTYICYKTKRGTVCYISVSDSEFSSFIIMKILRSELLQVGFLLLQAGKNLNICMDQVTEPNASSILET